MANYFDDFRKDFLRPAGGGTTPLAGAEAPKGNQGTTDWMAAFLAPFINTSIPDPNRWTNTDKIIDKSVAATVKPPTDGMDMNKQRPNVYTGDAHLRTPFGINREATPEGVERIKFSDLDAARGMYKALQTNFDAVKWNDPNVSKQKLFDVLGQTFAKIDKPQGNTNIPMGAGGNGIDEQVQYTINSFVVRNGREPTQEELQGLLNKAGVKYNIDSWADKTGGAAAAPGTVPAVSNFVEGPNIYNAEQDKFDVIRIQPGGGFEKVLTEGRAYKGPDVTGRPGDQVETIMGNQRAMFDFDKKGNAVYNPMFEQENRERRKNDAFNIAKEAYDRGIQRVLTGEKPVLAKSSGGSGKYAYSSETPVGYDKQYSTVDYTKAGKEWLDSIKDIQAPDIERMKEGGALERTKLQGDYNIKAHEISAAASRYSADVHKEVAKMTRDPMKLDALYKMLPKKYVYDENGMKTGEEYDYSKLPDIVPLARELVESGRLSPESEAKFREINKKLAPLPIGEAVDRFMKANKGSTKEQAEKYLRDKYRFE